MEWEDIKSKIYFEDGALRDIIIRDTDRISWKSWIDFINDNYEVEFFSDAMDIPKRYIDYPYVEKYFNQEIDTVIRARISIGNFIAMCYFFSEDEIEYDIDPKEIKSMLDHSTLTAHLTCISTLLNRLIILSLEGPPNEPLLLVKGETIETGFK